MIPWNEFSRLEPKLSQVGMRMLFPSGGKVGFAFLATLRRDGAPRLHPVSLVHALDRLFLFIPPRSPKCSDLLRDGRYALQAFPPVANDAGEEFCFSGLAPRIVDRSLLEAVINETGIRVQPDEAGFELCLDRLMYTHLVDYGTPAEHPVHIIWPRPRKTL